MSPLARRTLIGLAVAALLFVLYVAAGYWIAPRFVHDALVERARGLGLELRIEDLRTDPLALAVDLVGLELVDAEGRRVAAARNLHVDLVWASLWRDAWTLERAEAHEPYVELVRGPSGALLWPRPEETTAQPRAQGQKPLVVQSLALVRGQLRYVDRSRDAPLEIALHDVELEVSGLTTRPGERAQYTLGARDAAGGTLASKGTLALDPLEARGELSLSGVPLASIVALAAPGAEAGRGQLQGRATYAYSEGRFTLHDVLLEGGDLVYAGVALAQATLQANILALPPEGPIELAAKGRLKPSGTIAAKGTVHARTRAADLRIELARLPLPQAQRWLPQRVALEIASGALSANGRLRVNPAGKGPAAVFEGTLSARDLRLEERGSGNLLLGWRVAEAGEVKLDFAPYGVAIGELALREPEGRLIIAADGSVNFARVLGDDPAGKKGEPLQVSVRRLLVEAGTLEFADRSLEPAFHTTIRELAGSVTGLGTAPGEAARVRLGGRVEKYASARIRGTIDVDAPTSLADITATFRNLDLAEFTPYSAKFAGYRIASGRLSAELRYRIREGRVVGQNQLVIERLQLGEKVKSASALDLPLELAVALLADAKGRIELDIPVSGNLNDPDFDLGRLVGKAIGNLLKKVVSAPFRALASLGQGDRGALDEVLFAPGVAALGPPQEEAIAQLAAALAERPQLGVVVRAGYDPESDLAAVRRRAVRRDIARRAGYEGQGPLDFQDPKILQAAESLYLQRVGNWLELGKLRDAEPGYGRALLEQLAAATPIDPGAAQTLAQARAENVRAALLERGVDPSRIRVVAPVAEPAGKEGVPTQLSLSAELPAPPEPAQARAQPPRPVGKETLREAQRKLNDAGFDAGPIDGLSGPRTESALRNYQKSKRLEPTGRLDAPTRAALGLSAGASVGATEGSRPKAGS